MYANILMPILMNLGNLLYVLVALAAAFSWRWACPT